MIRMMDSQWSDCLTITRIYDLHAQDMADIDVRLATPDQICQDFQDGLIESVMIGVIHRAVYEEMRDKLSQWGIPLFELGKREDFYPASAFQREENPDIKIDQEGYELSVFTNMCGVLNFNRFDNIMFLFDRSGKLLIDHWDANWAPDNWTFQYDYPLRFDNPDLQPVPMTGDYCVLVKLWSVNYGHFTFENMDCVQLLEEAGFTGTYIVSDKPYIKEAMHIYGIQDDRVLTTADLVPGMAYSFERLYYPKLLRNNKRLAANVHQRLSDHMKDKLVLDRGKYPSRLFVERIGTRKLLNSQRFIDKYGLTKIVPEELSVWEQMSFFYNADIILCPHGANTTNSLYMRRGSVLVETFSNCFIDYFYCETLHKLGIYYLPVVESTTKRDNTPLPPDINRDYRLFNTNLEGAIEIAMQLVGQD